MPFPSKFALLDSNGRKIKNPGCSAVAVPPGKIEAGEVRFGPNRGDGPWTEAVALAALDGDGDVLGQPAPLPKPIVVGRHEHAIVGFHLLGEFAVTTVRVEIDDCHVRRGSPPLIAATGAAHELTFHEKAPADDGAKAKVG